jgi:GAF domain-containing protein
MRMNQIEITEINQELWSIRESLERQVSERTRAAESARMEAESARREAELQAWVTRGQAQLAEQMRGDLDIPTLANNITAHLSRYIGAQCGALFLFSGDVLKLTGRYAYTIHDGLKSEFRTGEGLVGEAARAREVIRVDEIPADAPLISSALGESIPRQILAAPLEWNGQVFGVVEFATLDQFTLVHENFLARVSESAAIALRTAQTRSQTNQLNLINADGI